MLVHVQHLGFPNILSNAGKICRHVIIQHFSADFFFWKKIKSNPAKSDTWSTEKKYFSKINEIFSCILNGIGLGVINLTILHHPTMLSLGCYSKSTERSTWMCHLFLLQGKHPHYPQSNSVVTQVCYNPTKLGNLPVHAENRVISKPKSLSCGWELGGASDLQRFWLLTPLDKDLLLSN